MDDDYPFLQRLGLDDSADARAIRRAYARELKQIDQALDAQGFQYLRECYETALAWAAWVAQERREGQEGQAVAPEPVAATATVDEAAPRHAPGADAEPEPRPRPASAPVGEDGTATSPALLGRQAFERFRSRFPTLPTRAATGAEGAWTAALDAALADGDLLNFDARLAFELELAQLLAEGWQPGHEALFPTAAKRLGWDRDRHTLARLGMVGELLDLALEERLGFFAQDVQARERQRQVLALLRAPAPSADRRILAEMAVVEQMLLRFPHWVPLIAPMAEVERWRERYWARKGHAAAVPGTVLVKSGWMVRLRRMMVAVVMGLAFMALMAVLFEGVGGSASGRDAARASGRYEEPPTQRQRDEIGSRIVYRVDEHSRPGFQRASFEVFLDEKGAVARIDRKELAPDPAFTAAVEKAIRESKPFPSWTSRRFEIYFSIDIKFTAAPDRSVVNMRPA